MKASYVNGKKIDDTTMELIASRVAEFNKRQNNSNNSSNELDIHIDALSEVFGVDKTDIEQIAQDVLIKQGQRQSFKDKLYDGVIKYSKEVIVSVIIITVVSLLLLGRSGLQQTHTMDPALLAANAGTSPGTSPDYSQFRAKANLTSVMASIIPIRLMMMEYYHGEGEYPQKLDEIGLDRNEMRTEKGIDDLILGEKGSIIVKLDEKIGDDLIIKLSPKTAMGGLSLKWECQTNFPGYVNGCKKINANKYLAQFR